MLADAAAVDHLPRLVHVAYAKQRPKGAARAYWGVRLRTLDPDGLVVSVQVSGTGPQPVPPAIMDGGCDVSGRVGKVNPWVWPVVLKPGRYRLRFQLTSSSCNGTTATSQTRTIERVLRVRASAPRG